MERSEIFNKTVALVKPFCKNEEGLKNVSESSAFLTDLGVNSARLVDIVLDIEDEFNIAIDDEAADKIRTVGDAVNLISSKLG